MPRFFLGVGLLCALFRVEPAEARRLLFDQNLDGAPLASLTTKVVNGRSAISPVEVSLHVSGVDIDDSADGAQSIHVEGLYENARAGDPAVSSTGALLAVPEGFRAKTEILEIKEQQVSDVYLSPFQLREWCHHIGREAGFEFNTALYASSAPFPQERVTLEEAGNLQGVRLVRVAFNPIQVEPSLHRLTMTSDLRVRVSFEAESERGITPVVLSPAIYDIAVGATVNAESLGNYVSRAPGELMVIVTADALKPGLGALVKWLAYKGIQTKILTTSEAGGTTDSIKANLQRIYDSASPRPSYLLMVGNERTAPAWMQKVSFENQTAVTDYPYSLLTGQDIIPDILYGRLVADNAGELKAQIDRWIQYEAFPERGATWYGSAALVASAEGSSPSDKDYALEVGKTLKSYTYRQVDGFFEGDKSATFANINNALTQGRSWVTYIGHGSGTAWQSTNDDFTVNEIRKLTNYSRLPVIFDVACLNADYIDAKPCFGKQWVTAGSGQRYSGAAAYYGGSVSISWNPPAIMNLGIAKSHFGKNLPSIGASVLGGHLYLIQQTGSNQDAKDNLTWYNLFGNPAMHLRTAPAKAYQVQTQVAQSGGSVLVQATEAGNRGVPGLRAAALAADGTTLLAAGTTDQNGRVTLIVDRSQIQGLSISTTGYNAETYKVAVKP